MIIERDIKDAINRVPNNKHQRHNNFIYNGYFNAFIHCSALNVQGVLFFHLIVKWASSLIVRFICHLAN